MHHDLSPIPRSIIAPYDMIEILLKSGTWAEIYNDPNSTSEELHEIATESGLIVGAHLTATMPNLTTVDCSQVVAIRASR